MNLQLRKIHHLIRYFVLMGLASYAAYIKSWNNDVNYYVMGPPIYIGYFIRSGLLSVLPSLGANSGFSYYGILLPITCLYFGLVGTLLKILWNEYGTMRFPTFFAFCGFLVFIHYFSGQFFIGYFELFP